MKVLTKRQICRVVGALRQFEKTIQRLEVVADIYQDTPNVLTALRCVHASVDNLHQQLRNPEVVEPKPDAVRIIEELAEVRQENALKEVERALQEKAAAEALRIRLIDEHIHKKAVNEALRTRLIDEHIRKKAAVKALLKKAAMAVPLKTEPAKCPEVSLLTGPAPYVRPRQVTKIRHGCSGFMHRNFLHRV